MKVDDQLVDKISDLARLEFLGEEKEQIKKDLQQILGFVEKLNEVNLDQIEPLVYITDEVNILRDDVAEEHVSKEQALRNVPLRDSDYIKVPKVIKK
ncbi:MAG: Asp-tRNA(Asn)/Glu-tRNA(Gln) amidotransferase subunit GatC [Bacteroidota bacterium]|jgi:aspartyl-tRNA(Asn)/glutamyl-tRNA(Gln) amidotransferase subunit C|nr:Asp-tRNA(Asn)/Glu-tRNA(Gln) amidotransferase subunit GatC [Bacteroidota bacterium]GDX48117.1 aspartyl/glutamyl-tRNA(Asn/Gln) amidotransferase subunit C [Bacteroidota bacterium]